MGQIPAGAVATGYGIRRICRYAAGLPYYTPKLSAFYGDYEASFSLDGEILAGEFPKRQFAFVKAWALLHEEDLRANWTLAMNGEETFRIEPLK